MYIQFDRKKLKELKRRYTIAMRDNQDIFVFEGKELVTGYAKYMIEYLETKL